MSVSPNSGSSRATRYAAGGLGLIVFLVGVALVGYVFSAANTLLNAPPPTVPTVTASPGGTDAAASSAAMDIGRSLASDVRRLLILLLMCFAGSVIASLGIRLFFSARNAAAGIVPAAPPHAPTPSPAPAQKPDPVD